jgi:hypothetical protein
MIEMSNDNLLIGLTGALAPAEIVYSESGLEPGVPDSGPVFPELKAFALPVFGSSETGSLFLKGQKH